MIRPLFLSWQYSDTYNQVKASTIDISHSESLLDIAPEVNCLNWLVGHIVVARCNFLTFLDVPSIWSMIKSGVSFLALRRSCIVSRPSLLLNCWPILTAARSN
jgi:hypothetical protein